MYFFSCHQAALRTLTSVCLCVCVSVRPSFHLSHLFDNVPVIVSSWNFQELLPLTDVMSIQKVKVRGQRSGSQRSWPHLAVYGAYLQFKLTYDNAMRHKAWFCLEEVTHFSRSTVKFQGHMAEKLSILNQIGRFQTVTPVWIHQGLWNDAQRLKQHRRGPFCFSRSVVSFQGHAVQKNASNFAFLDYKLQFEYTYGFETMHKGWCSIEEVRYCFSRSSIKFPCHTGQQFTNFYPN